MNWTGSKKNCRCSNRGELKKLIGRYVISWKLSNNLEIEFCLDCLNEALETNKNRPEIFNTDQGGQFTSPKFTSILDNKKIRISMDGLRTDGSLGIQTEIKIAAAVNE